MTSSFFSVRGSNAGAIFFSLYQGDFPFEAGLEKKDFFPPSTTTVSCLFFSFPQPSSSSSSAKREPEGASPVPERPPSSPFFLIICRPKRFSPLRCCCCPFSFSSPSPLAMISVAGSFGSFWRRSGASVSSSPRCCRDDLELDGPLSVSAGSELPIKRQEDVVSLFPPKG